MAKATKVLMPPPPPEIQLTLTYEEAQTLKDVLNRVGGNPRTSRRKVVDGINSALLSAGIFSSQKDDFRPKNRSIYFEG